MPRECRIEIVTRDYGIVPSISGIGSIQAVRAIVTFERESRSHVVVRAGDPPWVPPDHESHHERLARLFPGDIVSVVQAEAPGRTTLSCPGADEITRFTAACLAATVQRSWGWDETPAIAVTFASGETVCVDPVFSNGEWRASDAEPPGD